jgi:inorganic triphosphatase YgiF
MSIEIELKLQLDAKTARALVKHPLLANQKPQTALLLNTYYDTPKLSLHKRLIAVRYRKKGEQWLCTVKTAEPSSGGLSQRGEWETPAAPGSFDFSHVDNDRLRKFLEKRKEKLEAVFTTDFKRQTWDIAFGESQIELALDRGKIESCGRQEKICEIELELLAGKTADLFGLALELQKTLHLRPSIPSKAERGYNLFLNRPLTPFHAQPVSINKKMTPIEAFRIIALNCLEQFQRNEAGILASDDPEFVHQARIAIRRLRSAIQLFRGNLPLDTTPITLSRWRLIARQLGEARDWNVLLTETVPALQRSLPANCIDLIQLRSDALEKFNASMKALRSSLQDFSGAELEFTSEIIRGNSYSNVRLNKILEKKLCNLWNHARLLYSRLRKLSSSERHHFRVKLKQLRYGCSFLPSSTPQSLSPKKLKNVILLQEILGKQNDLVNAERLISELRSMHSVSAYASPRILARLKKLQHRAQIPPSFRKRAF